MGIEKNTMERRGGGGDLLAVMKGWDVNLVDFLGLEEIVREFGENSPLKGNKLVVKKEGFVAIVEEIDISNRNTKLLLQLILCFDLI